MWAKDKGLAFVTGLLILFLIGVGVWILFLAVGEVAKIAGTVIAAVIGLMGSIIIASVNHNNQLDAQRHDHNNQLAAQQQHEEYMAKQENYKELLSKVGTFARTRKDGPSAGDALSSAHLASWAFGDLGVLYATNRFQEEPNTETLVALLRVVRQSLGQEKLPQEFLKQYNPGLLFPSGAQETTGIDRPQTGSEIGEEEDPSKPMIEADEVERLAAKVVEAKVAEILSQSSQGRGTESGRIEEVKSEGSSEASDVTHHGSARGHNGTQPHRVPPEEVDAEAPQEPSEATETAEEEPERAEPRPDAPGAQEGVQRPWYRRWFGG